LTLRRIQQPPPGIFSSRRRSSCSWMVRASFFMYNGFSLAFAWGLRRWLLAAARLDLGFPLRWQCALATDFRRDLLRIVASVWGEKTLRVLDSIYKSTGDSSMAGWICFTTADSAAAPDPSMSSSRRALSRGLGYV
jgi:hypothetical protein